MNRKMRHRSTDINISLTFTFVFMVFVTWSCFLLKIENCREIKKQEKIIFFPLKFWAHVRVKLMHLRIEHWIKAFFFFVSVCFDHLYWSSQNKNKNVSPVLVIEVLINWFITFVNIFIGSISAHASKSIFLAWKQNYRSSDNT